MVNLPTFFPLAFSVSSMETLHQCQLKTFREQIQHLSTYSKNPDLIAGGHIAKACEIVRTGYFTEGLDEADAIENGVEYILDAEDTGDSVKSNEAVAFALRQYFKKFRLSEALPPCSLADGTHAVEYCLTGEHEVLTKEGWVRLDSLVEGIEILTWENGEVFWDIPYAYVKREYKGNLIKLAGKFNVSCIGIPEHRIPLYSKLTKRFTDYTLETLPKDDTKFILSAGVLRNTEGHTVNLALLRFMVALQADGSFVKSSTGNYTGAISFGFKKNRKVARLIELLENLNFEYTLSTQSSGVKFFYIKVNALTLMCLERMTPLKLFGWWLLDYNKEALEVFIEELQYWDGHKYPYGIVYVSKHKINVDIIQAISAMVGKATTRHFQLAYRVIISDNPEHKVRTILQYKEQIPFEGFVYCPSVKSSYFVVRHNGKISITGNCFSLDTGIVHPELPEKNILFNGRLDYLCERVTHNSVTRHGLDEKTCKQVFRVPGSTAIDYKKEADQYRLDSQILAYSFAARALGVPLTSFFIRRIPIMKEHEPAFELELPVNNFQIDLWWKHTLQTIMEYKEKYLLYKATGVEPESIFLPEYQKASCLSYNRLCRYADGCMSKDGMGFLLERFTQKIWDRDKREEVELSKYLESLNV